MFGLWLSLTLAAPPPPPSDAECKALPALATSRLPFQAGEKLDYDIDLIGGIKVGAVEMEVRPPERIGADLLLPIRAHAKGDGLVASIGKLESDATSWLRIHDLHPVRYREDYSERGAKYWTDVSFTEPGKPCRIHFTFGQPNGGGERTLACGSDGLDVLGAFYLMRGLEFQLGQPLCFDMYGTRHVWRVWGNVVKRESITTPAGQFVTLRLQGYAASSGPKEQTLDLSVWLTDDSRHLPVESVAGFSIGPVRAVLTGLGGDAKRSDNDR
jgi:hypothetical protein